MSQNPEISLAILVPLGWKLFSWGNDILVMQQFLYKRKKNPNYSDIKLMIEKP